MNQVKEAYVNFLNHCYVDTEIEMKEIYASNHMWTVFEKSFLPDMNRVADQVAAAAITTSPQTITSVTLTKSHYKLVKYVCDSLITVIGSFFGSPFSTTAAAAAAAAAVSTASSSDHQHHHHRLQTGADESGSGSSSTIIASPTLATSTNAAAVVQVMVYSLLIYVFLWKWLYPSINFVFV